MDKELLKKIEDKSAVVGIVGLGYVGLPLSLIFVEGGFRVMGFDVDPEKVASLEKGESYIAHIAADRIARAREGDMFTATSDFIKVARPDVLLICVPTPLNRHREPDISFVTGTMDSILPYIRPGQLISLESTTYPGTTEEELQTRIESRGFTVGKDFFLVYSPEREDPANPHFHTKHVPKVCGGITPSCLKIGQALYGAVMDQVVPVTSTRVAELAKLLENIYRAVNIGLVNELKIVADRMGIDIHEVIAAAATKPFGFTPFYPGPGLGGHCIPIDPFYLTWKARAYGVHTRFIELAGDINRQMPEWVVHKTMEALNERGRAVKGAKVLILGLAYKKNVDDMRESPAVEILHILEQMGAELAYHDPYIPTFPRLRRGQFDLTSVPLTPESLAQYDCAILVTNHDAFDYEYLAQNIRLIVDTRGVYRDEENVVKA